MNPFWTNGVATLWQSDARQLPLADKSVHCVITSPPYWGLRDYGLAEWEGGDAECDHRNPIAKSVGGQKSTLWKWGNGLHPEHPYPSAETQSIGWPNGICGKCGAVQQVAGIGLEPTLGEWLDNIVAVGREIWRVLRDDGTFWLNLGDAYAASSSSKANTPRTRDDVDVGGWSSRDVSMTIQSHLPPKNLMGQPWRAAFALQDDGVADRKALEAIERIRDELLDVYEELGQELPPKALQVLDRLEQEWTEAKGNSWILRSAIVWHKLNPMPESVRDRPTNAYEMVFLFSKQARYFYDAEAVRQPHTTGTMERFGNGGAPRQTVRHKEGGSGRATTGWNEATPDSILPNGANLRNVWTIPTQGRPEAHFATFPDELPRRCILAGTSEYGVCADCGAPWRRIVGKSVNANGTGREHISGGTQPDSQGWAGVPRATLSTQTLGWQPTCECNAGRVPATVFDPFIGSGTTCAVAQQLGRNSIGVDLNPEYLEIAKKRIGGVSLPLGI